MIAKYHMPKLRERQKTLKGKVIPKSFPAKAAALLLSKTKHEVVVDSNEYYESIVTVDTRELGNLMVSLMDSEHLYWLYNNEIDRVIVGPDIYNQLMIKLDHSSLTVDTEVHVGYKNNLRLHGLKVQLLPNIEGFLVIPKMK